VDSDAKPNCYYLHSADAKGIFLDHRLRNLVALLKHPQIFAPIHGHRFCHHRKKEYVHLGLDILDKPVKFLSLAQDLYQLRGDLHPLAA
jgi:hypothetical protein